MSDGYTRELFILSYKARCDGDRHCFCLLGDDLTPKQVFHARRHGQIARTLGSMIFCCKCSCAIPYHNFKEF